jgi:hypothetical protein
MSAIPINAAQPRPEVSPFHLFSAINAIQLSEAIQSAVELDLFTAIGAGHRTAAAIARECKVAERGARILCDYLVVNAFLTKSGQEYFLTDDSAMFLDKKSPAYMGTCTKFLLNDQLRANFRELTEAVRRGGTTDSTDLDPEWPGWVDFAKSMAPMMMMASQGLAQLVLGAETRPIKVLDIAAGHGLFGIAVLRANPKAESSPSIGRTCSRWPRRTPRSSASATVTRRLPEAYSTSTSARSTTSSWFRTSCTTSIRRRAKSC